MESEPPYWLVYFGTDDLEASTRREVGELGGSTIVEPMDIGPAGSRVAGSAGRGVRAVQRAVRRLTNR